MSRVLGDLMQESVTTKLADGLYCGGDTPEEVLSYWARVLEALSRYSLRLSAHKTLICPRSAMIRRWVWTQGKIMTSKHCISAVALQNPPITVHGLHSFVIMSSAKYYQGIQISAILLTQLLLVNSPTTPYHGP